MHAIAGCAETVCGQAKRGVGAAHGGRLPVYRQGLDLVRAACTSPRVLVFSRLALAIAICISLTCSRRAPAVLSGQAAFAKLPVCRRRALTRAERASPPADTPPEHGRHRCVTIQSLLRISSRLVDRRSLPRTGLTLASFSCLGTGSFRGRSSRRYDRETPGYL